MNNNNMNDFNNMQNVEQNDYYNNDSYYSNSNYDNNYSDTSYEEKEKKSGIWWKILLAILVLLIIIFLLLKFCSGNSGKKSQDQLYADLRTKICDAANTYVSNNPSVLDRTEPGQSAIIKFQTLADANLIEPQVQNPYYDGGLFNKGTQPKYYSMDNSVRLLVMNGGEVTCELIDNSNDVTAPELRLNGDAEITLAVGTEFEDPGYTATDDYDGDITDKVVRSGNVDPAKAGEYELTYTVQDSSGNPTTKKRKIIYEEYADIEITLGSVLDGVTPQISLKGSNPYCMVKGTKYVEPGAVATDNVDGNITDRISVTNKVTGNVMGSFRIVYKVEDSSGNQAIAYRAVLVTTECPEEKAPEKVANKRPTITLVGKNSVTINKDTEYIDLGATAYDKEDGDITSKIVTDTTNVKVNSAGVYKVIYRVTDSAGATATATRTVTVKAPVTGKPSVRFTEDKKNVEVVVGKGSDSLIKAPKAVNENGVQVSVTSKIEDYTTKQAVNSIDWEKAGKYRVIYTATHGNGVLKQTKTIVVTISNDKVTIGGKNSVNVMLRDKNCDITEADLVKGGVTFTSKSKSTPIVTITGNKDKACKVGTYEVTVSAKVDNGTSSSKKITVYVVNATPEVDLPTLEPSKVRITGNSANPSNVYNTNGVWVGGAVTGITVSFEATPAKNTEIAHFEWSTDCTNAGDKISKLSSTIGTLSWTKEGKNSVCIRAVTKDNVAGPWSDPVKLYIDRTGPKVEFTHTWKDGKSDWHNSSSLTLQYKASDSASGLDHFEYTYDDVKAKKAEEITTYDEATGKLVVNENTEPTRSQLFVYVRAVDKAGNFGEWTLNPAYANMDTVKPGTPVIDEISGDKTSVVKLTVRAKDNSSTRPSGIGNFVYTLNGTDEKTVNATALRSIKEGTSDSSSISKCPSSSLPKDAAYTAIEDYCTRKSDYNSVITMPSNTTTSNKNYDVMVWAVDRAGNKSEGYANKSVTVAPAKIATTGVNLSNDGTNIKDGEACSTKEVNPNGTFTLVAKPIPENGDLKDVVWRVDDASVAVIDENGKVTAKKAGSTKITAKIGEVSTSCTLTVTAQVTTPTPGPSTPTTPTCPSGYAYSNRNDAASAGKGYCGVGNYSITQSGNCYGFRCSCTFKTATEAQAEGKRECSWGATVSGPTKGGCYSYTCKTCNKTCPAGYRCEKDANGCITHQQNVCLYGGTTSAACSTAADKACSNGYTGCSSANQYGCYTYTCKSAPTITCNVANCKECSSSNVCKTCSSGYTLSGGKCIRFYKIVQKCLLKDVDTTIYSGSCTYTKTETDSKTVSCRLGVCNCPSGYTQTRACSSRTCTCSKSTTSTVTEKNCIAGNKCKVKSGWKNTGNTCSTKITYKCHTWGAGTKTYLTSPCSSSETVDQKVTCGRE